MPALRQCQCVLTLFLTLALRGASAADSACLEPCSDKTFDHGETERLLKKQLLTWTWELATPATDSQRFSIDYAFVTASEELTEVVLSIDQAADKFEAGELPRPGLHKNAGTQFVKAASSCASRHNSCWQSQGTTFALPAGTVQLTLGVWCTSGECDLTYLAPKLTAVQVPSQQGGKGGKGGMLAVPSGPTKKKQPPKAKKKAPPKKPKAPPKTEKAPPKESPPPPPRKKTGPPPPPRKEAEPEAEGMSFFEKASAMRGDFSALGGKVFAKKYSLEAAQCCMAACRRLGKWLATEGVRLGKVWSQKLFAAIGAAVGRARGQAGSPDKDQEMLIGGGVSAAVVLLTVLLRSMCCRRGSCAAADELEDEEDDGEEDEKTREEREAKFKEFHSDGQTLAQTELAKLVMSPEYAAYQLKKKLAGASWQETARDEDEGGSSRCGCCGRMLWRLLTFGLLCGLLAVLGFALYDIPLQVMSNFK